MNSNAYNDPPLPLFFIKSLQLSKFTDLSLQFIILKLYPHNLQLFEIYHYLLLICAFLKFIDQNTPSPSFSHPPSSSSLSLHGASSPPLPAPPPWASAPSTPRRRKALPLAFSRTTTAPCLHHREDHTIMPLSHHIPTSHGGGGGGHTPPALFFLHPSPPRLHPLFVSNSSYNPYRHACAVTRRFPLLATAVSLPAV